MKWNLSAAVVIVPVPVLPAELLSGVDSDAVQGEPDSPLTAARIALAVVTPPLIRIVSTLPGRSHFARAPLPVTVASPMMRMSVPLRSPALALLEVWIVMALFNPPGLSVRVALADPFTPPA